MVLRERNVLKLPILSGVLDQQSATQAILSQQVVGLLLNQAVISLLLWFHILCTTTLLFEVNVIVKVQATQMNSVTTAEWRDPSPKGEFESNKHLIKALLSSTLTHVHLRKAKLMFFYTRYPSSSVLKSYFPDINFNKSNTAQLVKWFSNFR